MIYLDTSVALAALLAEDRRPPADLWRQPLVSSRLLVVELWCRLHALGVAARLDEAARELTRRLAVVELSRPILERASEPFPTPVRTLDALHLASLLRLRELRQEVALASYDERQCDAARRLGLRLFELP